MPNGGSDCCGTCWFNSKNKGRSGYHGSQEPGVVRCVIRNIEIFNPFYTYCANHPHHNKSKIDIPMGPVYIAEMDGFLTYKRTVWLNPPDNEEIRQKLLETLEAFTGDVEQRYPSDTSIEEEVIGQLMLLGEKRAISGLLKIIHFDIEAYRYWDRDKLELEIIKNKANTVGQAIEALLKISGDEYFDEVQGFIKKGLENDLSEYNMENDNFAVIRYHLIRGLQFVKDKRAIDLLQTAKDDPHDEVRAFAEEILNKRLNKV
jgi:hypothetical protein